ncbi:site-specific integrase [Caballeronia sp. dw_276]|uniref:site-specific integrase n=1 Tax=Caballeronia sp. dw_276 TaxID=2719795 RepID=UPI001BD59ADC|nr:site-specific integrase [Caballeronia sp. dw_276]
MPWTVDYSIPAMTAAAGFGKVAHLPFIMDSRPGYHRLSSRFLLERGLGKWHPETRGQTTLTRRIPTPRSIKNYADWLVNFLEWAEMRKLNLTSCDYVDDIVNGYQKDMEKGKWSRDGKKLSNSTINCRVMLASELLLWMFDKGLRPKFEVVTIPVAGGNFGKKVKSEVRLGNLRENKRRLRMPSQEELILWLNSVYRNFGFTYGLMCESILTTAMRREEIACLRVDSLPEDRREWHLKDVDAPFAQQRVLITIQYGVKGQAYGEDHGDKIGPRRDIWIPMHLAERWHAYRSVKGARSAALKRRVATTSNIQEKRRRIKESVCLFLDEKTGNRISSKQLYHAWTGGMVPYRGWSPHRGRDWWSCATLMQELEERFPREKGFDETTKLHLAGAARDVIRFIIQPQLGHVNEETTMIYLQWFMDAIARNVTIGYDEELQKYAQNVYGENGASIEYPKTQ